MNHTQSLIIGSGPAGYTAAIYLVRSAIDCLLIEGLQVGGQLTQTTTIENFPGFPEGIDGFQLMDNMRQQAVNLGAKMKSGLVTAIDMSQRPFLVTLDGGEQLTADTIIVATGATAKYLGLPDETKYAGQGVSACATCDGFFYRKKVVAVVGGGDTACEEADYLSHLANKVYLIVRKDYLRASEAMQLRVQENDKIEILFNTNTVGLYGENGVEGAHLVRFKGTDKEELFDSATVPTPSSWAGRSTLTNRATSSSRGIIQRPTSRACLPPATWPTRTTARLLPLPQPAAVPPSTSSSTFQGK